MNGSAEAEIGVPGVDLPGLGESLQGIGDPLFTSDRKARIGRQATYSERTGGRQQFRQSLSAMCRTA